MTETVNPPLVICVEDDASVRDALRGLLRASGFRVAAFASAEEFLASAELAAARCLITDIHLAGISGLDLLDKLSDMALTIPSILITAHADAANGSRSRSSSATNVFLKPVNPSDLLDAVRVALKADPV
ncbi:response regulator transcription factor [Pararhizobium sp. DWP3-4]|uniref:response regulator transcription factor n=1 Tax=unclassified Pararhizobium TaxID=2643050 RepID=UPI003CF808FD